MHIGKQGFFSHRTKTTSLFWLGIISLILTSIYSYIILRQGFIAKKMITYLFKRVKQSENQGESS